MPRPPAPTDAERARWQLRCYAQCVLKEEVGDLADQDLLDLVHFPAGQADPLLALIQQAHMLRRLERLTTTFLEGED